jgi:hypothetical protein
MREDASVPYLIGALSHNIGGICLRRLSHNFHNINKRDKSLSIA